jgi:hypothetical protein
LRATYRSGGGQPDVRWASRRCRCGFYIVAPSERRGKVVKEVNRPTFARLSALQELVRVHRVREVEHAALIRFSEARRTVEEGRDRIRQVPPSPAIT